MAKRHDDGDDDGGGLDSLLDTMTNVVGILVIVLVVTQLGVSDAVDRIAESEQVDPAALDKAKAELQQTLDEQQSLNEQLEEFKPVDEQRHARRLEQMRERIERQRRLVQQAEQAANEFAMKIEAEEAKAEAAKKKIAEFNKGRDELQEELTKKLAEVAKKEAILDDTPERETLPPRVVNLPNPRPAPEGVKPAIFLCANNKVYPLNLDVFRDTARKRAEFVVQSKRLDLDKQAGIDPDAFLKEYKKAQRRPLSDEFFNTEISARSGAAPTLKFTPRENDGVTEAELLNPRSRFNRLLANVDKEKYYARFYVLPDSYDIYITARKVVSETGMLAGWEPQSENWNYVASIYAPRLGPPPKPDPNPPKPQPPSKPANVID
ncbi:MAG: hypothetical protein KDA42_13095 [Planctomycetales bacterium]|nr:hypothetical protein [Planctomycetales bacterium]